MASFNAYPPLVLHPTASQHLDIPSAHTLLSTFLHLANLDPAYHPDSTLTERGPQSNSTSGNPNLTLHHLNRIKLGLEGNNLGAEDLAANRAEQDGEGTKTERGKKRKRDPCPPPFKTRGVPEVVSTTANEDGDSILTAQNTNTHDREAEGWQDREDFELAQDDEDIDVNNAQRDPAAAAEVVDVDMGEGIMEEETGRMIHVDEELESKDTRAEAIRTGDVVNAQRKGREQEQDRDGGKRTPLTRKQREERKKQKKMRREEEKIATHRERATRDNVKTVNQDAVPEEKPQRKKKKSKA